ncbi:hypothetical protein [Peredibacter starrii]|uniref:Uncharacterized protein n=1 Tax=Peredibacter starrii TaxID=28202 RepID=A0AAX4HLF6_9BACT|nr:hypothetical protein [Peredibacter starrii]WPU64093.1 hypothetical protein SOO65_15475 [Peredibacter starrii]
MKKIAVLMALSLTTLAFAESTQIEFDQNLEVKCHQQAVAAKCVSNTGEPNFSCIEKNINGKVSKDCKSLYRANSK